MSVLAPCDDPTHVAHTIWLRGQADYLEQLSEECPHGYVPNGRERCGCFGARPTPDLMTTLKTAQEALMDTPTPTTPATDDAPFGHKADGTPRKRRYTPPGSKPTAVTAPHHGSRFAGAIAELDGEIAKLQAARDTLASL